jgi:hypothetical protein
MCNTYTFQTNRSAFSIKDKTVTGQPHNPYRGVGIIISHTYTTVTQTDTQKKKKIIELIFI